MPASEPLAAVAFLTRLPLGRAAASDPEALLRAAPFFPLVGAAIGLAIGLAAIGLAGVLPALLAGLLAVALELVLTGALHLDGLADSADGLGGADRDGSLAIMRDHALGTYGTAALALDLLIKGAALGVLADAGALAAVVAALALSRAAPLPLARLLPYARAGEGTGRLLTAHARTGPVCAALALAVALVLAVYGLEALPLVACAAAITAATGLLAHRRLGGITGDVMGAAIELSATAALVVAVALEA